MSDTGDAGRDGALVTVYEDGPLVLRGEFTVAGQDGQPIPAGRRTIALCRCGQSALKPFCDGSHSRTGFRAPGGAQKARPGGEDGDRGRTADAAARAAGDGEPAGR